jgi:transcriptional regulator with XRE-family HTH domain
MPARIDPGTIPDTKLARVRMSRRVSQEEMADAMGVSVPTYRRLERNQMENRGVRYIANAALAALGVRRGGPHRGRVARMEGVRQVAPAAARAPHVLALGRRILKPPSQQRLAARDRDKEPSAP